MLHRFGEDFAVEGYLRNPYRATGGTHLMFTGLIQETGEIAGLERMAGQNGGTVTAHHHQREEMYLRIENR